MDDVKRTKVRKKRKKRRHNTHHVQNIDIANCSGLIQVGVINASESRSSVNKKKRRIPQIYVENLNITDSPGSVIQVGRFSKNRFVLGGTDKFTSITTGSDKFLENTTAKSLLMSSWSKEQVRCWLMNITLPSSNASQLYLEGVNGLMLKKYEEDHLKKDFRLNMSSVRLISYLRKSWLRMERNNFRAINSSSVSTNISVPASFTCDMVKAKDFIEEMISYLNTNLRSFRDLCKELHFSELKYLDRSDLLVGSNCLDYFLIELLDTGQNNITIGLINVPSDRFSEHFIEGFGEMFRKIKDTGLVSYILCDVQLNSSFRKLLLYEKNVISVLTDNLFFRLPKRAFIRNSVSPYEVITNDSSVFCYDIDKFTDV